MPLSPNVQFRRASLVLTFHAFMLSARYVIQAIQDLGNELINSHQARAHLLRITLLKMRERPTNSPLHSAFHNPAQHHHGGETDGSQGGELGARHFKRGDRRTDRRHRGGVAVEFCREFVQRCRIVGMQPRLQFAVFIDRRGPCMRLYMAWALHASIYGVGPACVYI